jgi:bacterioferritin-associated ferredoxin
MAFQVCDYFATRETQVDEAEEADDDEPADDEMPMAAVASAVPTWFFVPDRSTVIASADGDRQRVPAEWFEDPGLTESTPWTVGEDLRGYGMAALWNSCHASVQDECLLAPRSRADYAYYLKPAVDGLAQRGGKGVPVPVGIITMGTGHASLRAGAQGAVAHYDNTGTQAAYVNVGENDLGIWVAGAARRALTDDQLTQLAVAYLSGDWRKIRWNLELVALLAVNTPGYPTPAARTAAGGPEALVAAGVVTRATARDVHSDCGCGGTCGDCDAEARQMAAVLAELKPLAIAQMEARIHAS